MIKKFLLVSVLVVATIKTISTNDSFKHSVGYSCVSMGAISLLFGGFNFCQENINSTNSTLISLGLASSFLGSKLISHSNLESIALIISSFSAGSLLSLIFSASNFITSCGLKGKTNIARSFLTLYLSGLSLMPITGLWLVTEKAK